MDDCNHREVPIGLFLMTMTSTLPIFVALVVMVPMS